MDRHVLTLWQADGRTRKADALDQALLPAAEPLGQLVGCLPFTLITDADRVDEGEIGVEPFIFLAGLRHAFEQRIDRLTHVFRVRLGPDADEIAVAVEALWS